MMAGITLAEAEARLQEYLTAESAVLSNQSYRIKDREMTRADLKDIREGIVFWDSRVRSLSGGGRRARFATPTSG